MGKKRKGKETTLEQPTVQRKLQTDVAKEIDDIFAAKKAIFPPTKPKVLRLEDGDQTTPNVNLGDLASVQKQVQVAKFKSRTVAAQSIQDDVFADIRGTKKRIDYFLSSAANR